MKRKIIYSLLTICFLSVASLSFATNSNGLQAIGKHGDNAIITSKVKALMLKNSLVSPFNVKVTTKDDGIVYLEGKVDTEMQYEQAIIIAESIEGVNDVNVDNLKVKDEKEGSYDNQYFSDTFITGKIKGKILQEKIFGDKDVNFWNVNVETKQGIVYLYGWVDTENQKSNITDIVKRIKGVKSVQNRLIVK